LAFRFHPAIDSDIASILLTSLDQAAMKPPPNREADDQHRAASEAEQAARDAGSEILGDAEKAKLAAEVSRSEDA
jgi:hypothetical protein